MHTRRNWPRAGSGVEPINPTPNPHGSYLDHVNPDKRDRLMKELDVFLERDRDRELFELAPNKEISDGNPDWNPLPVLSSAP